MVKELLPEKSEFDSGRGTNSNVLCHIKIDLRAHPVFYPVG
jgi:hypothetical protein